jgi:hypothetical protein
MVTWTVPQHETSDVPTFSLSGVFVRWPDGAPALITQTNFAWNGEAWLAGIEVSSQGGRRRFAYATLRLEPSVAASWQRRRVNPRREAAAQIVNVLSRNPRVGHLGTVTLQSA